jgi:hypothetical protein
MAEDRTVATIVLSMLAAGIVLFVVSLVEDNDKIRELGLAGLGGILLLLTAYFTARNLQISAKSTFNEQLMRASELLSDDNPIKQAAGRETLRRMKRWARKEEDKATIDAVLAHRPDPDR